MDAFKSLIVAPLMEMLAHVMSFIPTLVSALVVLIFGIVLARVVRHAVEHLMGIIQLDKLADKTGLSELLHNGGVKFKLSDMISGLVHLIIVVTFLIMTLQVLGIVVMGYLVDKLIAYVPEVISAVIILALGMIMAKIVGLIIYGIANNVNLPNPTVLERVARWSVLLYIFKVSLTELGYGYLFVGKTFHILFIGLVFALSLAFGLGGKDMAAKYLDKKR